MSSVTLNDTRAMPQPEPSRALSIAVQKRIGTFMLDIALATGDSILAIVGASGSGKTLTLRAIAGLLTPDDGNIAVGQRVLFDARRHINVPARERGIGYVFQQYALFPHFTVEQNVGYGLHRMTNAARRDRVREVLDLVDLAAFGNRLPRTLSGGEQQRVALARALAPQPAALLLDEPLSAVDASLRRRLGNQLRQIGATLSIPMVLVTHDMSEAERVAGKIVYLDNGRVADAPPPE